MPFAILRTAKLKSGGEVAACCQHNFRERSTMNADPGKKARNRSAGAQNAADAVARVKARLAAVPTVRKNAVFAIEYFIGGSPEWFEGRNPMAYFADALKWLRARHGAANVVAATCHLDEISPHIHALVVPIDPRGRLNAAHFLDGRKKLSQMQTEFAETVGEHHGLSRGIEGSVARHATVKEFYKRIQQPTPKPKIRIPNVPEPSAVERLMEMAGFETDHTRAAGEAAKARREAVSEAKAIREIERAKAVQFDMMTAGRTRAKVRARTTKAGTHEAVYKGEVSREVAGKLGVVEAAERGLGGEGEAGGSPQGEPHGFFS